MTAVDISQVSAGLFITGAIFILLIFSLLSLGILRMFQLRFKAGWLSFAGAVASGVFFIGVLDRWFM
ncbi:hypothetical protein BG53_05625 [Paenibacillus darwinianus]|uniref:Uncharacterized protein n=1 Tax=Paenibacillus darwinianus TaxID=1380763 RepID=A0A9W5S015_9BACL|nr:hypothetical protein [Paenibacillus darwinianus]EXX86658.1 hypothetical protein BG53_05625 [Paenibacillus darwinianus]EXX86991.1 hypothetical protein BG52_05190 [Paenibacillus darwinianus]EXX91914.1 hypothetical protein CH50_12555 [Paenibacillus darwinianus]